MRSVDGLPPLSASVGIPGPTIVTPVKPSVKLAVRLVEGVT